MKRTFYAGAVAAAVVLVMGAPSARANNLVQFGFGQMKNLYIDLVFWGWGEQNGDLWQDPDARSVMSQVQSISTWLNTGWSFDGYGNLVPPTPGMEAAIHTYGVSGVSPGYWVSDFTPINPRLVNGSGTAQPGISDLWPEVHVAWEQIGDFGLASDFNGNAAYPTIWGLPPGSNRLTLVITKGTNGYNIDGQNDCGFHTSNSGHPWGAVMKEGIPKCLSHEIMEAMTNPFPDPDTADQSGWFAVTGRVPVLGYDTSSDEVADECVNAPGGTLPFAQVTVDPTYNVPDFYVTATQSCLQNIPEEHAPLAAAFEMGGNGQQPLELVYIDTNGHLREMGWNSAGGAPSNPRDLGQPSPTVKAAGKPSMVFSTLVGGERIFVKGTDQAVWMYYNSQWISLGGMIYGDPQAVVWFWQGIWWTHVFALGLDENIYGFGIVGDSLYGWGPVPYAGTSFVGSPVVVTRDNTSLDLFALGEDGTVKQATYNPSTGWSSPITRMGTCCVTAESAFTQTPSVAVSPNGTTVLAAGLLNGVVATEFTATDTSNGWWGAAAIDVSGNGNYDFNSRSLQGSVAFLPTQYNYFAAFTASRQGELWYFWNFDPVHGGWLNGTGTNGPLVAGNSAYPVTGDPLVMSRFSNEMEVFYRTSTGQLGHLTYNQGWLPLEVSLPPGSIR